MSTRWLRPLLPLILTLIPLVLRAADPKLSVDEARARAKAVSAVDYALELELTSRSRTYLGTATVGFDLVGDGLGLFLDFEGEELIRVAINGVERKGLKIVEGRIRLPAAALAKGRNEIVLAFRNEFDTDGSGLHKVVDASDGREYVYTDFEPYDAHRLFPCFDQPDLKASYLLTVTAPSDWEVVANGRETSQFEGPRGRVHRFERTARFSTYIMAVCAGPFAVWSDPKARVPARLFATRSMAPYMDEGEIFQITRQGMDFFDWYFGIPYPFGKYDQVFLPQFNAGAMENVACVTFNDRFLFRHQPTRSERERRANVILHEMAHMWFGDLVTMRWWDDLWLNESFATFMADLALARATRFKESWETFHRETKGWAYWQDELPTTHPICTPVPDTDTAMSIFDGITYGKGASVLKQLAFFVGEAAFRAGVSEYLRTHSYGNATLADFMGSIGKAAGKDLGSWTRAWLESAGVNTLRPRIELAGGKVKRFTLEQLPGNGAALIRPHRVKVAAYPAGAAAGTLGEPKVLDVVVDRASVRVPALEGIAAPAFVYANAEDHGYGKFFLDERSLDFARRNLEKLESSFLRTVVWRNLWFMVRDRAIKPDVQLELALAKLGQERDFRLVASAWENAFDAWQDYLPAELREAYAPRLKALARAGLARAEPGSDLQKTWFKAAVAVCDRAEDAGWLLDLLEGRASVAGLELDQEKRWSLVGRLAWMGHPRAAALLASEEARDKSERGIKAALRARAQMPDAAVKAALWKRFTEKGDETLDLLREGMGGFMAYGQLPLVEPYVRKWVELLPAVVKDRETSFARSFARGLFPSAYPEPWIREAVASLIEEHPEFPATVGRSLVESLDELERALAILDQYR